MSSEEEEFIEELYRHSELNPGCPGRNANDLILRSFSSFFIRGNKSHLDLRLILSMIDHSKLSLTEKLTFLTITIPVNNHAVYNSPERRSFFGWVQSALAAERGPVATAAILRGLE